MVYLYLIMHGYVIHFNELVTLTSLKLKPCRVGSVGSVSASRTLGRLPAGSYQRPS